MFDLKWIRDNPATFDAGLAKRGLPAQSAEVLALDMLTPFQKNMMDPAVGRRYRDTILAQGGQEEEMALVKRFLGRAPSNAAFFAEITGKR